jgi:hypothetical protein
MLTLSFNIQQVKALEDGLIAYYPFNGNANDESGHGNNGTVYGAILTEDRFGNTSSAYSFDGIDDYVEIPDSTSLDLSQQLTVAAWVYPLSTTDCHVVSKGRYAGSDTNWQLVLKNGQVHGVVDIGGTGIFSYYGSVSLNTWQHVALVVDSNSGVRLFLDGLSSSLFPGSGNITTNDFPVTIGARSDLAAHLLFNGTIDDVHIFNRTLSEEEIIELYDASPPDIKEVSQIPLENNVLPEDEVKVNVTVTDDRSGVKQVTLNYTNGNGTWVTVDMMNINGTMWNATIPAFPYCTNITYVITAEDNANNTITSEDKELDLRYHVIPELPSFLTQPLFMIVTLLAVVVYRKRRIRSKSISEK